MITAKNYAAQAERDLLKNLGEKHLYSNDDKDIAISLTERIAESVKFVMPDNGVIFNDNLKGLKNQVINLPFDCISVEYLDKENGDKYVIIALQHPLTPATKERDSKEIYFWFLRKEKDGINFYPSPLMGMIKNDIHYLKHKDRKIEYRTAFVQWYNYILSSVSSAKEEIDSDLKYQFAKQVYVVSELLEALSCTNVEATIHQPASPKNAQRIKSHKLPIYETKVLTIKAGSKKQTEGIRTGTHQSPRQHLRRGHIRRLESGNIWVNSCVVGAKENGVINKSYKIIA